MAAKHDRSMILGFDAATKLAAYQMVNDELDHFFAKYTGLDNVARMATINSFLAVRFPYWHFVGFYVVREVDGERILHIGPVPGEGSSDGYAAAGTNA
jgi:putative methionine-R-sulfoxide reductase with GAF domain